VSQTFWTALAAALAAMLVTTAGIFTIRRFEAWARRNIIHFICFAAGLLVTVSLLHLAPKAYAMNGGAPLFVFLGFFGMHFLNRSIRLFTCGEGEDENPAAVGLVPVIGIAVHSLIDGVVFSVTFEVSVFTGTLAALGMVFHEFPEGIIVYTLMLSGGFGSGKALLTAFLAAALSTPIGVLASYPFLEDIGEEVLGSLLALAAGALVYVGATHLLPEAERENRAATLLSLAAGIAVALAVIFSK
jgi:zinc transporter ZupT